MSDAPPFTGKTVPPTVQPCTRNPPVHWVEIELHDQDGHPVANEAYTATLPSGESVNGFLDASGFARFAHFDPAGTCKVQFPKLDGRAWDFDRSAGQK